jgi:hypothetical protein
MDSKRKKYAGRRIHRNLVTVNTSYKLILLINARHRIAQLEFANLLHERSVLTQIYKVYTVHTYIFISLLFISAYINASFNMYKLKW